MVGICGMDWTIFESNDVAEEKQIATMLTVLGASTYGPLVQSDAAQLTQGKDVWWDFDNIKGAFRA